MVPAAATIDFAPLYKAFNPFRPFKGTTLLRGITIAMVINHLQVLG